MDILTIEGGRPLKGEIRISGAKNAALPILIATLLTDEPCEISNVPDLADIETVIALLVFLGKKVIQKGNTIEVLAGTELKAEAPYELVRKMRASVVVMGPILARLGRVKVSLPGGCTIGGRPINIHLDAFKSLGAAITLDQGYVEAAAKKLVGTTIHFDFASVGATENVMMAAALSEGKTVISNAAMEPEIVDLADFLNAMGAKIQNAGTQTITIEGVKRMKGATHAVVADRIEAGTYIIAAAMTGGDLTIRNMHSEHLAALLAKLRQAGVVVEDKGSSVHVTAPKALKAVDIATEVHPGFPTDLQAQWMALMTQASGVAAVTERVFENRFMHVPELQRMGADIRVKGTTATLEGPKPLSGANVMVSDLRAGAALVLAALAAKGTSVIHRIYHLDRGYEKLEEKLAAVGAKITRSSE